MVGDHMLAAAGDKDELLDSGLARLLDRVLDHGLVHNGQHFLGNGLGSGQESGAHAGDGENSLTNGSGHGHVFLWGMVLKQAVSWHGLAVIVQFQAFGGIVMRGRKQIRVLAVVQALAWPLAAFAAPAGPKVIAEVQTALDRGDAQRAATLAEGALKERNIPALQQARLQLYHGMAQELLGEADAATHDFTAALRTSVLPPDERAQALLQRGFLRDGQGRLADAVADYTEVIAFGGDSLANALNNRANVYRRRNQFTAARKDYQAALAARGKAQYSWYGLGQIAEVEGDVGAARGYYAKAVAAGPSYVPAVERLNALNGPAEGAPSLPPTRVATAELSTQTDAGAPQTRFAAAVFPSNAPVVPRTSSSEDAVPADAGVQSPISLRPSMDRASTDRPSVERPAANPAPPVERTVTNCAPAAPAANPAPSVERTVTNCTPPAPAANQPSVAQSAAVGAEI